MSDLELGALSKSVTKILVYKIPKPKLKNIFY